jgi:hypothetical protein
VPSDPSAPAAPPLPAATNDDDDVVVETMLVPFGGSVETHWFASEQTSTDGIESGYLQIFPGVVHEPPGMGVSASQKFPFPCVQTNVRGQPLSL